MRALSRTLVAFYAAIPLAFIGWNLAASARPDRTRWPAFGLNPTVGSSATTHSTIEIRKLNLPALKASINRLPSLDALRQTGNSLRITLGQRLSWSIWGGLEPLMLFHAVELWASEGLDAGNNRAVVDQAADLIVQYNQRLRREGWTLVVVPIPTKLSIYEDLCHWPLLHQDSLTRHPVARDRSNELYQHLLQRLDAGAVGTVDLATAYRIHRNEHPDTMLYPPAETHWSGAGIRVAATATADVVARRTEVKRRDYVPSFLEVNDVGDIAAGFNPLPAWLGPLARVYRFKDRLVNGEIGQGYIYASNPTSLLVVAGTSYSGHYTWHTGQPVGFPWVLASYLQKTEMHNRSAAGQGSFHPFRAVWTERDAIRHDFARRCPDPRAPKILVWEFPLRDLGSISAAGVLP